MKEQNRDFVRVAPSRIEGTGVFAKRRIPLGTRIIEYTGEHIPLTTLLSEARESRVSHAYLICLNDTTVIDGSRNGNEARFINHSCSPNCEAYVFDNKMYIYAMADIVRGEELTFDYKLRPADPGRKTIRNQEALTCHCGSKDCRGTMRLKKRRAKTS